MASKTVGARSTANNVTLTRRGVLIPIERWRALTETMLETAGRAALAAEFMVERCDMFDGDPDLEPDDYGEDDDPAGQYDEDEWTTPLSAADMWALGPGCPISDPAENEDNGI